jgi:hypothetical protein
MNIWLVLLISIISFFAGGLVFFFRKKEIDKSNLYKLQKEEDTLLLQVSSLID